MIASENDINALHAFQKDLISIGNIKIQDNYIYDFRAQIEGTGTGSPVRF